MLTLTERFESPSEFFTVWHVGICLDHHNHFMWSVLTKAISCGAKVHNSTAQHIEKQTLAQEDESGCARQPTHGLTGIRNQSYDQTVWGKRKTNNAVSVGHCESIHPLKHLQPSTAWSKQHSGRKRKPLQNIKKVSGVCLSVSLYLTKSKSIWYVLLFFFALANTAVPCDTDGRWSTVT